MIQFDEFKLMLLEDETNPDVPLKKKDYCAPDNFIISKQKSFRLKGKAQRV